MYTVIIYFIIDQSQFLWRLFLIGLTIYAVFDWRKNKKYFFTAEDSSEIRNHYLSRFAWVLKILTIYSLAAVIQTYFISILFYGTYLEDPGSMKGNYHTMQFQNYSIPADLLLGDKIKQHEEFQQMIFISDGFIPVLAENAILFHFSQTVILFTFGVMISLLMLRLFSSSVTNPFSQKNVNRIRLIAVFWFFFQIATMVLETISSEIVKGHYELASSSRFQSGFDLSPFFLCFTIFLIAELVRLGWVVKEEQDLTV